MKLLEGRSEAVAKYKEELLGSSTEVDSPDLYNLINVAKQLNIPYPRFKKIEIHDRAKMIAQHYLENMVDLIRRHDSLQKQKMEKFNKPKK